MSAAKHLLGLESGLDENDDDAIYDDAVFGDYENSRMGLIDESFSFTFKERLVGFVTCVLLGWALSLVSLFSTATGHYNPKRFVLFYTFGNILSLCGGMFLYGPVAQLRSMFDDTRRNATLVYLLSMCVTMYAATQLDSMLVVLVAYIVQVCAMIWYCASYIPYGRNAITAILSYINPFSFA